MCILGEDGGYINAVEASSQNSDDKQVKEEADEVNSTFLFACAICYFLLDSLLLQIRLRRIQNNKKTQTRKTFCEIIFSYYWHYSWTAVIYPELIQQTASLQLCSILIGDAEIPAGKDLVAKALKAIRILDQVAFESRGRP